MALEITHVMSFIFMVLCSTTIWSKLMTWKFKAPMIWGIILVCCAISWVFTGLLINDVRGRFGSDESPSNEE
tara:strand:- start:1869 stop:2084 length:216 start_codon:yes stop_codon:yes gene_type:complete